MAETPNTGQVECWMCGELFTPDPAALNAWAASGQDWEPTDWQCNECIKAEDAIEQLEIDRVQDAMLEYWSSIEDAHSALGADYENTDWQDDDFFAGIEDDSE